MAKSDYTAAGVALQKQHDQKAVSPVAHHKAFLDARLKQLATWVRGGVKPEALMRFALMDMSTNVKLQQCSPESIYLGLLACAVSGLEPGALKGEAYLVPFAGKAQFMVGWKGIVKQARRSSEVKGISAQVVRDRDEFTIDLGTANSVHHTPARGDRGDIVAAYAIATLSSGLHEIEYLDRDDLEKIRAVADKRGSSAAWKDWPDQMSRKSALRRLGKRLPLGDDYYLATAIDTAQDDGKEQRDIIDLVTDGAGTSSAAQMASAPVVQVANDEEFALQEAP